MKKVVGKDDYKIKELEAKITELTNNWKRALADYQNLERRTKEEKDNFVKYAKVSLIEKLLPIMDSLEKVKMHLNDQGLNISVKALWDVLTNEGLQKIEAMGRDFDPFTMQAIDTIAGKDEEKVVEVYQDGYLFSDKVIRPAQVKVGARREEKKY